MTQAPTKDELKKFSFRNGGKVHRGGDLNGFQFAVCKCPGSRNGRLLQGAVRVAEGWDEVNCGN